MKQKLQKYYNLELLLIISLYILSFGWLLPYTGLYRDDWEMVRHPARFIEYAGKQGVSYFAYFVVSLRSLTDSILLHRIGIFGGFLFSAICLYYTLLSMRTISPRDRLLIVIIFTVFPVNFTRNQNFLVTYALAYACFFAGLFVLSRFAQRRTLLLRVLALLLFFLSFTTNSFLVFYSLVIFYLLYIEQSHLKTLSGAVRRLCGYLDFWLLPIVFWMLRQKFFSPTVAYNDFNLRALANAFSEFHRIIYTSFIHPLLYAIETMWKTSQFSIWLAGIGLMLALWCILQKLFEQHSEPLPRDRAAFWLFILGFALFMIALVPYYAVDKGPQLLGSGGKSRHQLLVPLGAALMVTYSLKILVRQTFQSLIYATLISLCVFVNFFSYLDIHRGWFKQLAIIEQLKPLNALNQPDNFVLFNDETKELNALQSELTIYEYTGMLESAFGNSEMRWRGFGVHDFCEDWHGQISDPTHIAMIKAGRFNLTRPNTARLLYRQWFAPSVFQADLLNIVTVETKPIDDIFLQNLCQVVE